MNILMLKIMFSYIDPDVEEGFRKAGCRVVILDLIKDWKGIDTLYEENRLIKEKIDDYLVSGNYDAVYTTNYFPFVAYACYERKVSYLSWYYDTPPVMEMTEDLHLSTNRLFFFNKDDTCDYQENGIKNVFYLPLAVNTERLKRVIAARDGFCSNEVSLVGRLYRSQYAGLRDQFGEYDQGYLDAILAAQQNLYDAYIVPALLSDPVMKRLSERYEGLQKRIRKLTSKNLSFAICARIAYTERVGLLRMMGGRFDTSFYTAELDEEDKELLSGVHLCEPVDYGIEMPLVFSGSKINLCPILRNNRGGIPLRVLDVMGCGGFVLAPFQPGLVESFEDMGELVMYHSLEEAVELAGYYLANESLRKKVAQKGRGRIEKDFGYASRIANMLEKV